MSDRASRYTIKTNEKEFFSDFLINFDKNPVTGFLAKAKNEAAIEQSMYNIIMTNLGEWPFENNIGSKVRASMFALADPRMQQELRASIEEALKQEPRAITESINLNFNENGNSVLIDIQYSIVNIPNQIFDFSVTVNRVR